MTVPFTAGAPCSYWTLTCLAVSSALHSLMGFLFVSPVVCLQLPSDSISRWTPLLFGYPLPTAGRGRDFHPLERAPAGRTNEIKHAARVLSRYRDARRTRILRIRLRLTVRVNKKTRIEKTYSGILRIYPACRYVLPMRATYTFCSDPPAGHDRFLSDSEQEKISPGNRPFSELQRHDGTVHFPHCAFPHICCSAVRNE